MSRIYFKFGVGTIFYIIINKPTVLNRFTTPVSITLHIQTIEVVQTFATIENSWLYKSLIENLFDYLLIKRSDQSWVKVNIYSYKMKNVRLCYHVSSTSHYFYRLASEIFFHFIYTLHVYLMVFTMYILTIHFLCLLKSFNRQICMAIFIRLLSTINSIFKCICTVFVIRLTLKWIL